MGTFGAFSYDTPLQNRHITEHNSAFVPTTACFTASFFTAAEN